MLLRTGTNFLQWGVEMSEKRLNIGLLISEYCDIFAREVCNGAMYAAEEMDAHNPNDLALSLSCRTREFDS